MIPALLAPAFTIPTVALSAFAGGYLWLKFVHEPNIRSAYAAELAAQVAQEKARLQEASLAALEAYQKAQQERQQTTVIIRESVARAPQTASCASSPAMRAALDGLRGASTNPSTPANPAKPTDLSAGGQTR